MINQAVLANQRAIAKLSLNLMETELKREGTQRLQWQDLIKAWKSHEKERVITEFRLLAEKEMEEMPSSVKREVDLLTDQHQSLHSKRLQLLCLSVNTQFVDRLHNLQRDTIHRCTTAAEACQAQLMNLNICSKDEAETILTKELSPIIAQFQMKYDKEQKLFSDAMITVSKQMDSHTNKLFKYAKKAVHLWDVLQIGLAQQEKNLQKNLDCCRKKHDAENQVRSTPVLFLSPFL
ncbi:hypothetical protein AB205_0053090 [Aquarana catesbeiana]|uniref:DUF4455 domain-containing protein n=1 Tax=Aquarana catesbeiana TaxID=8400 RepID=A0A2G9RMX9_AQUCT|nr:hypothetical protein AB205_0053090 [Aquarana catesbeiana]